MNTTPYVYDLFLDEQLTLEEAFGFEDFKINGLIQGTPLLHKAVAANRLRVVQSLLSHPQIDLYQTDLDGQSALGLAAQKKRVPIFECLLKHPQMNTDDVFDKNVIPLHIAYQGNVKLAKLWTTYVGASAWEVEGDYYQALFSLHYYGSNISPLDIALHSGHQEMIQYLVEHTTLEPSSWLMERELMPPRHESSHLPHPAIILCSACPDLDTIGFLEQMKESVKRGKPLHSSIIAEQCHILFERKRLHDRLQDDIAQALTHSSETNTTGTKSGRRL